MTRDEEHCLHRQNLPVRTFGWRVVAGLLAVWTFWSFAATAQIRAEDTENTGPNVNIERWAEGTYEYRTTKTNRTRGWEQWKLFTYRDGSRTMIMWHDVFARNTQFTSVMRVDRDLKPLEAYVSYWTPNGFKGSGWFVVDGTKLKSTSIGPAGTVTQEFDAKGPFSISTHPLASDGWHYWFYDKAKGGDQLSRYFSIEASRDLSRPITAKFIEVPQALVGEETITIPAGTFTATRYHSGNSDAWIATDDSIVIRSVIDGDDPREYVLVDYKTGASPLVGGH